jgi:protein-S-isoprenylcysteine O-methyltransferase Ste14
MSLRARALVAFLALPGVVAFAVPAFLADVVTRPRMVRPAGLVPFVLGCALLAWCVREFYVTGRGTLAPWEPPRHLVTAGPYRWSRNPMYVAVLLVLAGWAIMFPTRGLWAYALIVAAAFHLRVTWFEEPWLVRTHGEAWRTYRSRVRRWL